MNQDNEKTEPVDVQNTEPEHAIPIDQVGVTGVQKYIRITRPGASYCVVANIHMHISLPSDQRGANMSRFVESVQGIPSTGISLEEVVRLIAEDAERRHKDPVVVTAESHLPISVPHPDGSDESQMIDFSVTYNTASKQYEWSFTLYGASACPCSKEQCGIPHMQKSKIEFSICGPYIDFEAIELAEDTLCAFSSPILYRLKRPDESALIIQANKNAKFVEDIARHAVVIIEKHVKEYRLNNMDEHLIHVVVTNDESIHPHKVFARASIVI